MNIRPILFCALLSSLSAIAGEETVSVTAQSLSAWTSTGSQVATGTDGGIVTLPAGGQLARTFASNNLVVQLRTQPSFSDSASEWPVLEVGPLALVLSGDAGRATLVLVEGDAVAQPLSFAISLQPDGTSQTPLDLSLAVAERSVTVKLNGKEETLALAARLVGALEVAVSASASTPWRLEQMTVTMVTPDDMSTTGGREDSPAGTSDTSQRSKDLSFRSGDKSSGPDPEPDSGEGSKAPDKAATTLRPDARLEVFTPPAVRHGRSAEVRATISKARKN